LLTSDKWRRIERLFEAVEDAAPADRVRLLEASGEDESIRLEVLRMLDASSRASANNSGALLDVDIRSRLLSSHSPGDLLANRFRIESLIAEGGMGEVYRAFDTELQIPVALKTIHRILARHDFAIERFKQEVQLARSINHPNVCRIFDIQKHQGRNGADEYFLTMELLAGETLRAYLDRKGRLSEKEALSILDPLLEAMKASHELGVLHLDLKPSNIHLATVAGRTTPRVVVTDFGLATTSYEAHRQKHRSDAAESPLDKVSSGAEIISAGTPAYMAPEQFDRKPASPATDIYAAGIVFYEMLCGRLPFSGRTPQEIRQQKTSGQRLQPRQFLASISGSVEGALERTLEPDPARRLQSASAFLAAIRPKPYRYWLWGATAAAVIAYVAFLFWPVAASFLGHTGFGAPPALRKLTSDAGYSMEPAIASDGETVFYSSDRGPEGIRNIWKIRPGGSPAQVTFDPVDASAPTLSADGRWLAYRSERDGGGIYLLALDGGNNPPAVAASARLLANGGDRPRFSPDSRWVLYTVKPATSSQRPEVFAISIEGGKSAHISDGFRDAHNPVWSPDGKHVLFCGTRTPGVPSEEHDWWIIDFPLVIGGSRKTGAAEKINKALGLPDTLTRSNDDLAAWQDGYVYYVSPQQDSSSIWRVKFDASASQIVVGIPQRLTYGATMDLHPAVAKNKLVFASSVTNLDVWALPLNTATGVPSAEPLRVTDHLDMEVSPAADASGKRIAFTARGSKREVRTIEWGKKDTDSILISEPGELAEQPIWSPDSQWIAFRVLDRPKIRIYMRNPASGEKRLICADCGGPTDWSPDQRYILYEPGATIAFVGLLDIASGEWVEWIRHPQFSLRSARYSPDGKWIAFQAETATTERRVFIAPNESQNDEDKWISIGGPKSRNMVDFMPAWSPDGNILYFLSQRDGFRCIWAQKLNPNTKRPVGEPFEVQHFHRSRRSLLRIVNTRSEQVGFRVGKEHAFFSMDEVTGNLWTADLPK
jgi:eukaryotic-like serine/threonine-protein kinase